MGPPSDADTRPLLTGFRRLLIFGGSFDPPHRAHVELPEAVRVAIGADVIVYVPAGRAPHKLDKQQTAGVHRLAMLRLALADAVAAGTAVVLDDEIRRVEEDGRPSYTVDTLESLKKRIHPDAELRLLIGTDQVRIFESWKDWQRIVELAEPVVMVRPPERAEDLPEAWRSRVVEVPAMEVSSTEIRQRIERGESLKGMLDIDVGVYIVRKGLYRSDDSRSGSPMRQHASFGEAWYRFSNSGDEPDGRDQLVSGRKVLVVIVLVLGIPVFLLLALLFWVAVTYAVG